MFSLCRATVTLLTVRVSYLFFFILTLAFCLSHLSSCTSDVISVSLFEICFSRPFNVLT